MSYGVALRNGIPFTLGTIAALCVNATSQWSPTTLFSAGEAGGLWDFTTLANLYQDSAGTTPCTAVGDPIGKVLDTSGRGNHLTQSTSTKRPTLGRMPATGVRNLLVGTATLSTQSVYVAAGSHTIQFTGAGSVTASGTYSGALTNGQTFTCTAGTLTLTVSGSVTAAQLEAGSTATAKQVVGAVYDVTESGVASVYTAYFDGVDDCLVSPSIDFSGTDKMSVFAGLRKTSDAEPASCIELSASSYATTGSFGLFGSTGSGGKCSVMVNGGGAMYREYDGYASQTPAIISGSLKTLAADSSSAMSVRINGVVNAGTAVIETGGTGNFSNNPIYVGQRGAASLPYKGFLSALCTRGAATDAATVTSMEKWMAARTPGVTLP